MTTTHCGFAFVLFLRDAGYRGARFTQESEVKP